MIPLNLRAHISGLSEDLVCRAGDTVGEYDVIVADTPVGTVLASANWQARLENITAAELRGDVLLIQPARGSARRLFRHASQHNTLLATERCDQLCVMCSQPPKKTHVDLFRHYKVACMLAPNDAVVGISGGEPTLYRDALFDLIDFAHTARPDLRFHVLTNAQHFDETDIDFLRSSAGRQVLWGVPLYSSDPDLHDEIVGKRGAHEKLLDGLAILCRAAATTELRTVVMKDNVEDLPTLARFIAKHVPFAHPWAIMQLENIGFARNRWSSLFYDHSQGFEPVAEAIDIARLAGLSAILYNFPLCTVPAGYRRFAPATISDWKRRYEPVCDTCQARRWCTGFFEWHPSNASYKSLGLTT